MTTITVACEAHHYEVIFGSGERDRQTYADYGDGSFLSSRAEQMATSCYLQMIGASVRCGFWADGVLTAGADTTDEPEDEPVEHKTRTFLIDPGLRLNWRTCQRVRQQESMAECTCGWSACLDNREMARGAAREHRDDYREAA